MTEEKILTAVQGLATAIRRGADAKPNSKDDKAAMEETLKHGCTLIACVIIDAHQTAAAFTRIAAALEARAVAEPPPRDGNHAGKPGQSLPSVI